MEAKLIKELPGQGKRNYFIIVTLPPPLGENWWALWYGAGVNVL